MGYYRQFVPHYVSIAAPFTDLLKKDSFHCTLAATTAFDHLIKVLFELPMLYLPDFTKDFMIETYASKTGIGGVLMQGGRPFAYFSKKLGPKMQLASTYVRELFALTEAMAKGRQYLLGRPFII